MHSPLLSNNQSKPLLKKNKGGSIINLSSTAGLFGFPLRTPYAASKWAIIGLTKSLAMELGEFDITVNNILPGYTATARLQELAESKAKSMGKTVEDIRKTWAENTSLKRLGKPEEISSAVAFLASDSAGYISGHNLSIDGGRFGA